MSKIHEGKMKRGGVKPETTTPRPATTPRLFHQQPRKPLQTHNPFTAYDAIAEEYADSTFNLDMSKLRQRFIKHLSLGAHILDAGAGAGRDSVAFLQQGFTVTIMEPSAALADIAARNTNHEVLIESFQGLREVEVFDGIWACASLLHVPEWELREVFTRLEYALKPAGVLYYSFKYGEGMRIKNDMGYMHLTEFSLPSYIRNLYHIDQWITDDVRPDRVGERWLNGILRKK